MLWSLSFVAATQAECVCCSERKSLFVRDLAPHQCLLCRKASAAIAWGSFMHWVHVQRALWKGNKKGNLCFLLSSDIKEQSQVVWLFPRCSADILETKRANLSLAEIPIHWHAGSLRRGADLNEELGISSEAEEIYWLLEIVLLPGLCRMYEMWHRIYEGSHPNLWNVKIVVWLKNQRDVV